MSIQLSIPLDKLESSPAVAESLAKLLTALQGDGARGTIAKAMPAPAPVPAPTPVEAPAPAPARAPATARATKAAAITAAPSKPGQRSGGPKTAAPKAAAAKAPAPAPKTPTPKTPTPKAATPKASAPKAPAPKASTPAPKTSPRPTPDRTAKPSARPAKPSAGPPQAAEDPRAKRFLELLRARKTLTAAEAMKELRFKDPRGFGGFVGGIMQRARTRGEKLPIKIQGERGARTYTLKK